MPELQARIYRPAKTAMQSGQRKAARWILEYEPRSRPPIDPLMGWAGSSDTTGQIRLTFSSRQEAEAYARRRNLNYVIVDKPARKRHIVSYSDNFRFDRKVPWTH